MLNSSQSTANFKYSSKVIYGGAVVKSACFCASGHGFDPLLLVISLVALTEDQSQSTKAGLTLFWLLHSTGSHIGRDFCSNWMSDYR